MRQARACMLHAYGHFGSPPGMMNCLYGYSERSACPSCLAVCAACPSTCPAACPSCCPAGFPSTCPASCPSTFPACCPACCAASAACPSNSSARAVALFAMAYEVNELHAWLTQATCVQFHMHGRRPTCTEAYQLLAASSGRASSGDETHATQALPFGGGCARPLRRWHGRTAHTRTFPTAAMQRCRA